MLWSGRISTKKGAISRYATNWLWPRPLRRLRWPSETEPWLEIIFIGLRGPITNGLYSSVLITKAQSSHRNTLWNRKSAFCPLLNSRNLSGCLRPHRNRRKKIRLLPRRRRIKFWFRMELQPEKYPRQLVRRRKCRMRQSQKNIRWLEVLQSRKKIRKLKEIDELSIWFYINIFEHIYFHAGVIFLL